MYGAIRCVLGTIILLIFWVYTRFITPLKPHVRTLVAILLLAVMLGMWLLPAENLILSFKTAEESFEYVYSEIIRQTVYGEDSAFVIGDDHGKAVYAIVPREGDRWRIGLGHQVILVDSSLFDNVLISVYQFRETGEHYVAVSSTHEIFSIEDSQGNIFVIDKLFEEEYRAYAYLRDYSDTYCVVINGESYRID